MMPSDEETVDMGDLIRFPRGQRTDSDSTDGSAVRAVAEPAEDIPPQPDRHNTHDADSGGELVVDTGTRAVEPVQRRPLIPVALAGRAKAASKVALPVTRTAGKATFR